MTIYAKGTSVPASKSRTEIETMLTKYGASKFASGWEEGRAVILFEAKGRRLRFELPMPSQDEKRFRYDRYGRGRPGLKLRAMCEAEERQRWRALVLVIKAKLEAVESGITTFDEEFLAHVVLPNGTTVGDQILPRLDGIYAGEPLPPLLGMGAA